ncbi:MAG: aldehyde dehydrogenase family protein, partial [Oligoflexales bacterium]|nr:aldehyde dehydrogenase family protein [Oligoflexales bacterium]
IIFSFHHKALECSMRAAEIIRDAAIMAGAPAGCIGWVEKPSRDFTRALISSPEVSLILATGGPGMVKTAYSSGKPAIGVGAGNAPCYFEKSADIEKAVADLLSSKTYDNGVICASEQSVVVDHEIDSVVRAVMKRNNMYFLNPEDEAKLQNVMFDAKSGKVNPEVIGKSAMHIASLAKLSVPENTRILVVDMKDDVARHPFAVEKLSPVLGYFTANDENGISVCESLVNNGGVGHTASIHSQDEEKILEFSLRVKACRILVNSPSSQGAIGGVVNDYIPSLTLGCGTKGGSSTSVNVNVNDLINVKRVLVRKPGQT